MNTYNTTYNFNQPSMNFGQAMLYGAFGSLTGGMGGCGFGSYGMGMGMGGSLFSMMGMGGFGGYGMGYGMGFGMSDNQYVGTLAGLMGSQILIGGISQAIQSHRAAKAEAPASKLNTVNSEAQKQLDILNAEGSTTKYTIDNFSTATVEDKYTTAVTEAKGKITEKIENINGKLNGDYADSKKPQKEENESESEFSTRLTKWEQEKAALEAEKAILLAKTDTKNELVKALLDVEKAEKDRKEAIDSAKKALLSIKTEYNELQAELKQEKEDKILDDADGNWLNRASKSSIDKYTGKDENGKQVAATKSQIRGAFNQYILAKKSGKTEDQKRYGTILANMHRNSSENFKDFEDAYVTLNIKQYES